MEKKYLVGYVYGKEAVIWDDVKDFTEESLDDGSISIKFKENNIDYNYVGDRTRGFREVNQKAPFITDYKLIGRRTALRHDYLNDDRRREYSHEYEDSDLYEPMYDSPCGGLNNCGAQPDWYRRRSGCGGGCGGSYGNYYRNPCGGGYSRCGGDGGC